MNNYKTKNKHKRTSKRRRVRSPEPTQLSKLSFTISVYQWSDGAREISVYDRHGQFVGDLDWVKTLVTRYNITDTVKLSKHSTVVSVCKIKNGYIGFSHRAIAAFRVGDKIKYKKNLVLLSSGWTSGSPNYKKELKEIEKVRALFVNGVLEIKSLRIARLLAKRFADAVS